jgi:hypothetical protein
MTLEFNEHVGEALDKENVLCRNLVYVRKVRVIRVEEKRPSLHLEPQTIGRRKTPPHFRWTGT